MLLLVFHANLWILLPVPLASGAAVERGGLWMVENRGIRWMNDWVGIDVSGTSLEMWWIWLVAR
jgi:hypothetical protein